MYTDGNLWRGKYGENVFMSLFMIKDMKRINQYLNLILGLFTSLHPKRANTWIPKFHFEGIIIVWYLNRRNKSHLSNIYLLVAYKVKEVGKEKETY